MTDAAPVAPLTFRHSPETGVVSCIVPVYNGERYVTEAVDSILRQSWDALDVIVVDDGSTDDTVQALAPFEARVRVIRQDNAGPGAARNHGLEESRGEFVAFLDADDIWVDDKLEAQLALLRDRPEVDLCSGHLQSFWIPELDHERARFQDHPYHREQPMLSPCTLLTRRSVFEALGGFDPALRTGEDTDWFIRFMRAGYRIETLPRLLLHRRQHTANLTREARPGYDGVLELIKRALDRERKA